MRISDERLAELTHRDRDLIADLREAREALNTIWKEGCCSCLGSMHDGANGLCAENIARAYFETKREGAE